jgi:phosphoglycolate phosphatase
VSRCVIYDLDGTLVDSAQVVIAILNEMRTHLGKAPLAQASFLPWLSLGGEDLVAQALEVSKSAAAPYLAQFRQTYWERPTPQNCLYPGAIAILESLGRAGVTLLLCTNKPRRLTEKVLAETQLQEHFSFISAGDDLPTKKPHPQNLAICLDHWGGPNDRAIYVGDSSVDLQLCQALAVPFIQYLPGYDDGIDARGVTGKIMHHRELLQFL